MSRSFSLSRRVHDTCRRHRSRLAPPTGVTYSSEVVGANPFTLLPSACEQFHNARSLNTPGLPDRLARSYLCNDLVLVSGGGSRTTPGDRPGRTSPGPSARPREECSARQG